MDDFFTESYPDPDDLETAANRAGEIRRFLKDILETDVATTGPDVVLEELFPLAAEADYPIAVVNEAGKFVGEIQISSIFENMIQEKVEETNE